MGKWYFQKFEENEDTHRLNVVPKNITLCKYFWSVVLCCWGFPGTVFIRKVLVPIYNFLDDIYHKRPIKIKLPKISMNPKVVRAIASSFMFGAAVLHFTQEAYHLMVFQIGLGLFLIFGPRIINYLLENRERRLRLKIKDEYEEKPKHHNLAFEYIKARKGKYCPVLRFYEPTNDEVLR